MNANNNMVSREVLNQIRENAGNALTELKGGKSAVEVAQRMYLDRLPNKDDEIARMMAENCHDAVKAFYENFRAAQQDYAAWCENYLNEQTRGLTRAEACGKLNRMYCTLTTIGAVRGAKTEAEAEEIRAAMDQEAQRAFTPDEATEELYAQLRDKVADALMDSGIAADQLDALSRILENAGDELPVALNFGSMNADVMTVLSMQAYLDIKNGLYEDVPVDATMEQVVCSICGTASALEIAAKVESGEIDGSAACRLLKTLGAVMGGLLLAQLGYLVSMTLYVVFNAFISPFIAVAVTAVTLFALVRTLFVPMVEAGTDAGEAVYAVGHVLLAGIKILAKHLLGWIKAAAERCRERVQEAIRNRQAAHAKAVQVEMATE